MKRILLVILLTMLSSCSLVDIEDYVHEPTHEIRNSIVNWNYGLVGELTDSAFILVPNFRKFSKSFSHRSGDLIVIDKTQSTILIESISLKTDLMPDAIIAVNKTASPRSALKDTDYFFTNVILFDSDSFDISVWNGEATIWLTINYSVNGGKLDTKTFKLEHSISKMVAWMT